MADYFDTLPNFVNKQYATPEQLAAQRAYADVLLKRSGENVNRPTGAIANVLNAVTSALTRNNANDVQQQAAQGNAQNMSDLIGQLQQGKPIDSGNLGTMIANPMISPEQRAMAIQLMNPKGVEDVAGRPGYASPVQGVKAAPVSPGFQPGFRAPEAVEGASTVSPVPAPNLNQRPPVQSSSRVWGDQEAQKAGLYPPQGQPGAESAPATAAPLSRLDALAAKGRELSAERARTLAGAGAESDIIKTDIAAANDAPNILKGVGVIKDNIQKFGDQITFGPSSHWSLEMKRAAANYAPGFMKDQLNAVAAADSINKVGIGLAGTLAGQLQGGSNADTFAKAMQGVPGLTTSKEGALAMADMIQQAALKQQQLARTFLADPSNYKNYPQLKADFFARHPIINPLTGNPIELDVSAVQQRGDGTGTAPSGYKLLKVH